VLKPKLLGRHDVLLTGVYHRRPLHHHHQTAHYLHQNLQLATAAHAPKPLPATPPGAAKLYAGHAAEPVPRRYTATPQMSHDLHDLQDDALRCYSRLDHSYMSIDHRDVEHIYSCVDHVNPHHHDHIHHNAVHVHLHDDSRSLGGAVRGSAHVRVLGRRGWCVRCLGGAEEPASAA